MAEATRQTHNSKCRGSGKKEPGALWNRAAAGGWLGCSEDGLPVIQDFGSHSGLSGKSLVFKQAMHCDVDFKRSTGTLPHLLLCLVLPAQSGLGWWQCRREIGRREQERRE